MTTLAAPVEDADPPASRRRHITVIALILSLLLNVAVLVLLDWMPSAPPEPEMAIPVQLAPPPPEAKKVEPPKPEPKPEIKPPEVKPKEEPKPEPKPEAKPKPEPPKAAPKKIEPPKPLFAKPPKLERLEKKPPPLHLKDGKIAEKAADGPGSGLPGEKGKPEDPGAKTVRDFLLGQILRIWSPPDAARGHGLVFHLKVDLRRNGMLGPPYAGDQPLDIPAAVADWNRLPPNSPARDLLAGLVRAIYMSQPFKLPPEVAAKAPMTVTLDFAIDDVPR